MELSTCRISLRSSGTRRRRGNLVTARGLAADFPAAGHGVLPISDLSFSPFAPAPKRVNITRTTSETLNYCLLHYPLLPLVEGKSQLTVSAVWLLARRQNLKSILSPPPSSSSRQPSKTAQESVPHRAKYHKKLEKHQEKIRQLAQGRVTPLSTPNEIILAKNHGILVTRSSEAKRENRRIFQRKK